MSCRYKDDPISSSEQLNQIADELCGYREAKFDEIMQRINLMKTSHFILYQSQAALSRRQDICDAVDQLMAELEGLQEEG